MEEKDPRTEVTVTDMTEGTDLSAESDSSNVENGTEAAAIDAVCTENAANGDTKIEQSAKKDGADNLPQEERSILRYKAFLYLTEFFTGVSVMAVELGASRLLAPYFSSSQIVWTIIIGTIMIAMALGNIYGGRQADKNPNPDRLYIRIIIAGLWIAAIPFAGKYVVAAVAAVLIVTINQNFLIVAAFISCFLLFVFPLFLLGTVTPCLVKYTVKSLNENGKTVGMMEAFNTIGSILGTFIPTFVTIPAVGTAVTFLIFAAVLLILAFVYFISKHRRKSLVKVVPSFIAFALLCVLGANSSFAFWDKDITYEGESVYNYLQVKENDRMTYLSTNVLFGVQSVAMKDGTLTGLYYDYALAAPLLAGLTPESEGDALILGMGTGTYATQLRHYFPQLRVEGVEIDEKITELAKEYFALPADVPVTTYDGRAYLNAIGDRRYDIIMVDAYQDITIPPQMSSVEFFTLVSEHLTDNGVMVVNMNMKSGDDGINAYLGDTISAVFPHVATVEVGSSTNRELFAARHTLDGTLLPTATDSLSNDRFHLLMERVAEGLTPYTSGNRILTDDKAPVELLGMSAIDSLIDKEISYYRDLFRREGLAGLLKEIR